jgi:nucleotide-binding universal stress UspA family protein
MGGVRRSIAQELKRLNARSLKTAERTLKRAGQELNRNGWRTSIDLRTGEALRELTEAVKISRAELIIVGARGASGVRHLLIGSVAEGVLNHSAVPVLLAR